MSVNLYEQRVKSLQRELDKQRKKQADEEGKAAKADQAAMRYASEAARARTESTLGAKLRQAESKRKEANRAAQTAAKASEAFAKASSDMADAQRKLAAAQANERKKELDKRSREQQRADRQQRDRNRQRDRELEQLRAHAGALESRIDRATAAPDKVTVLFIAASPEDQPPLRLDREVREIQRRFRETEHRDSVEFEWRVATHLGDLLQALNETKPHIVHFPDTGVRTSSPSRMTTGEPSRSQTTCWPTFCDRQATAFAWRSSTAVTPAHKPRLRASTSTQRSAWTCLSMTKQQKFLRVSSTTRSVLRSRFSKRLNKLFSGSSARWQFVWRAPTAQRG
jgi:hypothetical protein